MRTNRIGKALFSLQRNCTDDGKHFLMHCMEYDSLWQKLYFHISQNDANFSNLTDHDRTLCELRLENDNTCQVIAKYAHLMFQNRKQILSKKSNLVVN